MVMRNLKTIKRKQKSLTTTLIELMMKMRPRKTMTTKKSPKMLMKMTRMLKTKKMPMIKKRKIKRKMTLRRNSSHLILSFRSISI